MCARRSGRLESCGRLRLARHILAARPTFVAASPLVDPDLWAPRRRRRPCRQPCRQLRHHPCHRPCRPLGRLLCLYCRPCRHLHRPCRRHGPLHCRHSADCRARRGRPARGAGADATQTEPHEWEAVRAAGVAASAAYPSVGLAYASSAPNHAMAATRPTRPPRVGRVARAVEPEALQAASAGTACPAADSMAAAGTWRPPAVSVRTSLAGKTRERPREV
eukprot:scaffold13579_cov106-Isochrysis_galbana.AAC.4